MSRTASGARLWSKTRNVVSALRAFKRSNSKVERNSGDPSSYTPARAMTEMPQPRKRSKKGCIALSACLVFVVVAVIVGTVVGVTESKKHHNGSGDGDANAYSVTGICSRTL